MKPRIIGVAAGILVICASGRGAEKPVAVVNGEPIGRADFEAVWKRMPASEKPLTDEQKKGVQMELLALMIDEVLLKQFLKNSVAMPEEAAILQCVAQVKAGQKARGKTMADFYKETGVTEARFKRDVAASLQWRGYLEKRITNAELKKYYEANKEIFDGVAIRASHILVKVAGVPGADAKTEKAALERAQAIHCAIVNGMDFAEAAKKYSDDPNRENGGDLGYFPPAGADPDPFFRAASALKVGELSEPVRTEYGYHLIKVTDRKPGKPGKFEDVRDGVYAVLADEIKLSILAEMRKKAKVEQVSLP